ncbi:MAG: TonB-dependent receptor [Bacteroidota bacterium]|nr:TonB-dependent receptor [Bacteroidota bacterium]
MKRNLIIAIICMFCYVNINSLMAQVNKSEDTLKIKNLNQITISAERIKSPLMTSPSSISIVDSSVFKTMPKSIAVDEALRLVPGVRIDNQADGSRVHMSIRGQGILSERGLRGIKVLIDGIPVNDPSGFAADLYDIDWATLNKVEVLRGPLSSIYGSSSAAGVLNIFTEDGGTKPINGTVYSSFGSNGFMKGLVQLDGTKDKINYRLSYSGMQGDGYRDHTYYKSENLSEKIKWTPTEKLSFTQTFTSTLFFNQNAEGLSIEQVRENPRQANPDAIPFNEYQKTQRNTLGLSGQYKIDDSQNIQFTGFLRATNYKETSNKAADYRYYSTRGANLQYNLTNGNDKIRNYFSLGGDYQYQNVPEHKFQSLSNPLRVDNHGESNLESDSLLANQVITQREAGVFLLDKLEFNKNLNFNFSLRYDNLHNQLDDKLISKYNLSGEKNFEKVTTRFGIGYSFCNAFNVFANIGQGFMPPATEELANNPLSNAGFNQKLVPATSVGEELGFRGEVGKNFYYDVTGFLTNTKNDFFRFKLTPSRGNQEVFYGNAGDSRRYGVETSIAYSPVKDLTLRAAYTFSDFKYTSPDSIKDHYLPNSPVHQLEADVEYRFLKHFVVGVSYEMQSKWYIFTDPKNYSITQDGFNLVNARISYEWKLWKLHGDISVFAKNLNDVSYIAFTEPDPDKNSYQPAARREIFGSLRIKF